MRNKIETGNIISACKVVDAIGYEHPKHRDTRPDKKRHTPITFKLRELCRVNLGSKPRKKKANDLLRCILKHT